MSVHPGDLAPAPALAFSPRGPLSAAITAVLTDGTAPPTDLPGRARTAAAGRDVLVDDDVQLALFLLYALSYGSLDGRGAEWEWSAPLIEARTALEGAFEAALREQVATPPLPPPRSADVARALFDLTAMADGPSLARYAAKAATLDQLREFLVHRTVYTLREADSYSWAIPRLTGRAKAALVEIQADEYGGGDPERVHATLFARAVRGVGLDDRYAHYLDHVPTLTLTSHNVQSLFGINRRLLGALVGHLAAFEMTSSIPNRFYADAFRRHGFGADVTEYFDEHVEADAVHEQIAAHDLAGSLAQDDPALVGDIMFGAAACVALDEWVGEHLLSAWRAGRSALRAPLER